MQIYDVLMLVVLIAATIFGMWKGMAWQIASLASLVLSYFIALRFADQLAPTFEGIAPPPLNKFVAMLVIYMATSFVIWSLFRFISGVIDRVKLESFDRQMGAIFGFAKGVLLCTAITFFAVSLLPQPQKEQILASQTGRYIVVMLDKTDAVVPPEIHDVIGPYLHRINEQLDPSRQNHQEHGVQANWPSAAFPEWPGSAPKSESSPIGQPVSTPLPKWPPDSQAAGSNGKQY
ncbi:CvpA family protein [Bythopirellula polymerisocia]|uniref:Colicin V production protein n=1 Tax=Bythopirellula polymerisocia TaxID=2528003 RepID=A0A5C6CKE4_9BACT|nr:CvpA family protein [Bythopirellula polymerisocia]TWU23771.1 Colicin V production protein [Bythopirellula polymerisocia]